MPHNQAVLVVEYGYIRTSVVPADIVHCQITMLPVGINVCNNNELLIRCFLFFS